MKQIDEIIRTVLNRVQAESSLKRKLARERWNAVIDGEVELKTRILSYRNGTLKIGVESQPLLSELKNFRRDRLARALREECLDGLDSLVFEPI